MHIPGFEFDGASTQHAPIGDLPASRDCRGAPGFAAARGVAGVGGVDAAAVTHDAGIPAVPSPDLGLQRFAPPLVSTARGLLMEPAIAQPLFVTETPPVDRRADVGSSFGWLPTTARLAQGAPVPVVDEPFFERGAAHRIGQQVRR